MTENTVPLPPRRFFVGIWITLMVLSVASLVLGLMTRQEVDLMRAYWVAVFASIGLGYLLFRRFALPTSPTPTPNPPKP